MTVAVMQSRLPLPLLRRGKVREVYEIDAKHLLLVASDRVSAFDVVMNEAVPRKGEVLTQLSAWWFQQLARVVPSHFITADADQIVARVPVLAAHRAEIAGRAMLVMRTTPVPFECVVRGYVSGSAWQEYKKSGTLAGESLPSGLTESARFATPVFSPATKAEEGHDINVTPSAMEEALGVETTTELRNASVALYVAGAQLASTRGIIIADTKFEFGRDDEGKLRVIDEILTPDSSRFWPAADYTPGRAQPSFDKQPLRDYLAGLKSAGRWNGEAPPPTLPSEVVKATSERYLEAYRLLTQHALPEAR